MHSTPEARIGVAGQISGFVVAEDQSLQARLGRSIAGVREDLLAGAARIAHMMREKVAALHAHLALLGARGQETTLPEPAEAFTAAPVGGGFAGEASFIHETNFTDDAGLRTPVAPRRSKRLAGVLALHWLFRAAQMGLAERISHVNRYRAGVATLIILACLALGAALFLPDAESPAAAGFTEAPASRQIPLAQPAMQGNAEAFPHDVLPQLAAKVADAWVPVKRPILLYNLEAPDVEAASLNHRVAMRGKNARQDTLTWNARGRAGSEKFKPAVHLVVERFEAAAPTFRPLYPDVASRAAEQGISIDRMNAPGEIQTKFGGVQAADAVLATEQGPLGCLVFRQIDTIGLVFAGWYCGSAQRPADRVSLSCFIDRLDLVGAGQDSALKKHFAGAERNRKSCAGARQSGRRLTWLDHEAPMPALKLSAKAR